MSFAIAAVLVLVISGTSVVVYSQMGARDHRASMSQETLLGLEQASDKAASEAENTAYAIALDQVKAGVRNESELIGRFESSLQKDTAARYPSVYGPYSIRVNTSHLTLMFLRLPAKQLYPVVATDSNLDLAGSSVPVYFSLSGNMTVNVSVGTDILAKVVDVDRNILVPLPFLQNRAEAFSSAYGQGLTEFEKIVRYELIALAQLRVINGYGLGSKDGPEGTSSIITEADIENAVNVATMLLERKYFRTVDPMLLAILNSTGNGSGARSFLNDLADGGDLDAADLFLSLYGAGSYDLRLVLAQSLCAASDMIVLRWLDYLGIIDIVNGIEDLVEKGGTLLADLIDKCLGKDVIQEKVISWIEHRMAEAEYGANQYRYVHTSTVDLDLDIPSHFLTLVNDSGQLVQVQVSGSLSLDFPSEDLFSFKEWKQFYVQYSESTHQLANELQYFVRTVALGIASASDMPVMRMSLDPRDSQNYLSQFSAALNDVIADRRSWFVVAFNRASLNGIVDGMSESLLDYLDAHWEEMYHRSASLNESVRNIAGRLVDDASSRTPDMGGTYYEDNIQNVARCIGQDRSWIYPDLCSGFDREILQVRNLFIVTFNEPSPEHSRLLQNVRILSQGLFAVIPGLETVLERFSAKLLKDMSDSEITRSDQVTVAIPSDKDFMIQSEGERVLEESLALRSNIGSGGISDLHIEIVQPYQFDRSSTLYPNRHMVDIDNCSWAPFISQWNISLKGSMSLVLSSALSDPLIAALNGSSTRDKVPFESSFTISVQSGWALTGVEYLPTSTLMGDIGKLLQSVWQWIVDGVKVICDGVSKLFDLLQGLIDKLVSYCAEVVNALSSVMQALISAVQDFARMALTGPFQWIAETIANRIGTVSRDMEIFGLKFRMETNVADLALGAAKSLLKMTMWTGLMGNSISVSTRMCLLPDGQFTLLSNATLKGDGWKMTLVLDPFMDTFEHMIEIKGIMANSVVEVVMPEIVRYGQLSLALSDVPGFGQLLSNIPLPVPGLKGSIDAGFTFKYAEPSMDHPLINEYEQNPPGTDAGHEWVEIFNPTADAVCLSGWTIETMHGIQRCDDLGDVLLMPHMRLVYTFSRQALDNQGESKFPIMESIVLRDSSGKRVDSTPWTVDTKDDSRSWQRSFDGSDRWEFRTATKGSANAHWRYDPSTSTSLVKMVTDCLVQSLDMMVAAGTGAEGIALTIRATIDDLLERLTDYVIDSIIEIGVYVEVSIADQTGASGGGFRLSLAVTNGFVREALYWFGNAIVEAMRDLLNPMAPLRSALSMERLCENTWIGLSTFCKIGLPGILGKSPVMVKMSAVIKVNLATVGALLGKGLGRPQMTFGVLISGIPASLLQNAKLRGTGAMVDVWLLKASVTSTA
ncbi:MAG: lamin tail domain-containing protein [Methanomassiliicoccales archaeon]